MNRTASDLTARGRQRAMLKAVGGALLVLVLSSTPFATSRAQTFTVIDTTGGAAPGTTFSVFGSSGQVIGSEQFVGPQFTLTKRAVLKKIEAFVNNCRAIVGGVPQCPNTLPLVVQIRRSINGVPDPRLLIAATPLSDDDDPLTFSLESAELEDVPLEPGTYFVLFSPQQESDAGMLLASANAGGFLAGETAVGFVTPTGSPTVTIPVAVRIVAKVVHGKKP
jgi:hypothetical protein